MFFTGKVLHEFYFDLPDKMLFFTGQFIHSQNKTIEGTFGDNFYNIELKLK
jgi:hypothetical protein